MKVALVLAVFFFVYINETKARYSLNGNKPSKKNSYKALGKPVPMPQTYITSDSQHFLDEQEFSFKFVKDSVVCDVINLAFYRYHRIIFRPEENFQVRRIKRNHMSSVNKANLLKNVLVNVVLPCEDYPTLESDESYSLEIAGNFASIDSKSSWGALRALETLSQLIVETSDGHFVVNDTFIYDFPRFPHRGILLDTSRHYISTNIIKTHLEAMEANKMNVFHWHIVDDQSFPYVSYTYPDLSRLGAYDPYNHVYTFADVKDIIEFARQRGIRVVSEFDSPGHTLSWGKAINDLLTPCYTRSRSKSVPNGEFGPIDPTNNETYVFLRNFIKELVNVFPDKYLHLGGDEVDFSCWKSNPNITTFMDKMGYGTDYSKLEQFYMQNLLDIVNEIDPKTGYIIWQEVIDNNVKVKPDTVVEVWKDGWPDEMKMVTNLGYRALLSTCWYLNYISYGSDWVNYYKCDPHNFDGNDQQKRLVIGGEACMWGEYVDGTNVISRTWPRASAVAERLWSAQNITNIVDAGERLEEQRCRMIRRGIKAEPFNGSGYCDYEVTS